MFTILLYTNNKVSPSIFNTCISRLAVIAKEKQAQLICISWKPVAIQENIIYLERFKFCHETVYNQILAGLEIAKHDDIYLAEHDVLYPVDHFDLEAIPDTFTYNSNVYHFNKHGFFEAPKCNFLSTLVAKKEVLRVGIESKLEELETTGKLLWAEPGNESNVKRIEGKSPIVDIRHGRNLTGLRESETYLSSIDYWKDKEQYEYFWE